MALYFPASLPAAACAKLSSTTSLLPRSCVVVGSFSNGFSQPRVQCMAATKMSDKTIIRQSGNYQAPIWSYDYIQSLRSEYAGEYYAKRVEKLKEDVREMLDKLMDGDPLHQLELVDTLQRLGLSYHFEDEIKRILNGIYKDKYQYNDKRKQENLYAVALEFRLLRQHGFDIPAEIFNNFSDERGKFKSSLCNNNYKGILALYEAAYLLEEGEDHTFHEARNFTTTCLSEYVQQNKDEYLCSLVSHALELPLHWRVARLKTRWFIDLYEKGPGMNPILLELAKLDFNRVQATHQEDLKYVSKWWRSTKLGEKLSFARDRLVENFFWTVELMFEPKFRCFRRMSTQVNALLTTIDDVYDVYGTLDELELFTDAVDRWDVNAMDQLPDYMKLCFLAVHNTVNNIAYDILKEQGAHVIPYLKKVWADLCKSYIKEAKWYHSRCIPTFEEYLDNAVISTTTLVMLTHAYVSIPNTVEKEALEWLEECPTIIHGSAMILRLANDLGTSMHEMKRGDVAKSIQCYMHETGASEEEAREYVRELIATTWMKMNKDRHENPNLPNCFIETAMNLARVAQCLYQHGDGHGILNDETSGHILSILFNPVPYVKLVK